MEGKIPLINRIKKESHRQIAFAQDLIIEEVYRMIPKAVFHGGTCIWRCYSGKRFSDDLDFYFPKDKKMIEILFDNLKRKGFEIVKKKISERSVYSELSYQRTSVKLEATFQAISGVLVDYEKTNGTVISLYGLTPEQLIKEKISAYLKRRKIRDVYDVFFLLKLVADFNLVRKEIGIFIRDYQKPLDENDLKVIILEGVIPESGDLINYIKRKWEN